ncbi:hypothetical protein HUJ05_001419 [Dendroctonus ponderosae]|nr:hypothetical protein HUJ05_001419 [Dendroctonus ponderosae]
MRKSADYQYDYDIIHYTHIIPHKIPFLHAVSERTSDVRFVPPFSFISCRQQLVTLSDSVAANFQKRLRREKRTRKRLQDQLDLEMNRRAQLEEALRSAGASDQIDAINEKIAQIQLQQQQQLQQHNQPEPKAQQPKAPTPNQMVPMHQSPLAPPSHNIMRPPSTERIPERVDRIKQEIEEPSPQYVRELREPPPPPLPQENKVWGYSGLDLINSGATFWQNYSGKQVVDLY